MDGNKFAELFTSRKFWASVLGILASLGLYNGGDIEAAKLVEAIVLIIGTFTIGTGIESGLKSQKSQ